MELASLTWPDLTTSSSTDKVAIVPLGSIEQHGHHLPLITDTALAEAVARGVHENLRDETILIPTLWCGHSTHHLAFPGTISLSQEVYKLVLSEVCHSLVKSGFRRIFLLNGHGGNDIPARYAMREIKTRHTDVEGLKVVFASYWNLAADELRGIRESEIGGMGHACEMETSLMLHLHPQLVRMEKAERDGPTQKPPYRQYDMLSGSPVYMVEEFHELSRTGTVGHPDLASAEKGQRFYQAIVESVTAFVRDFKSWT